MQISVAIIFSDGEWHPWSQKNALSALIEQGLHFLELTVYMAAFGHPESVGIGHDSSCNNRAQVQHMI